MKWLFNWKARMLLYFVGVILLSTPLMIYITPNIECDYVEMSFLIILIISFHINFMMLLMDFYIVVFIKKNNKHITLLRTHAILSTITTVCFIFIYAIWISKLIISKTYDTSLVVLCLSYCCYWGPINLPFSTRLIVYGDRIYYHFTTIDIGAIQKVRKNGIGMSIDYYPDATIQILQYDKKVFDYLQGL